MQIMTIMHIHAHDAFAERQGRKPKVHVQKECTLLRKKSAGELIEKDCLILCFLFVPQICEPHASVENDVD